MTSLLMGLQGVVRKLFVSVFFNMFLDGKDGKGKNVHDACADALASVSAHMSWNPYYEEAYREEKASGESRLLDFG
uniref:Uncharacterized protein n=1 Tax=Noccaea caerulescens TaxID=107243 RepID=A0A1J3HQX9_NOCCA